MEKPIDISTERKPMTQEYYAGIKGGRCPACRSAETEGHSIEIDGGCALQEMTCLACNATWNATYRLRGYKNLKERG